MTTTRAAAELYEMILECCACALLNAEEIRAAIAQTLLQARAPLRWTKERPTKEGWYWWRRMRGKKLKMTLIEVKQWRSDPPGLYVYAGKPIERVTGEWAGPIEPPSEEEEGWKI